MKNYISKSVIFFLAIFVYTSTVVAQSESELKSQIEKINKEMAKSMIEGNYDQSLAHYSQDVISLPNYDEMKSGIAEIRESNEEMKKSGWKVKDFTTEIKSVKSHGNMVTEVGTYKIAFTMDGMDKPMEDVGKYVTLWEKQTDGTLKVAVEIWNTDKNPMQEMTAMGEESMEHKKDMGEQESMEHKKAMGDKMKDKESMGEKQDIDKDVDMEDDKDINNPGLDKK